MSRRLREAELRLMSMGVRANKEVDYLFQHIEELQAKVDGLEKDIENYKKACSSWEVIEGYSRKDAQRYKQALEFYADRFKYHEMLDQSGVLTVIEDDCGFTARQALEQNQHG